MELIQWIASGILVLISLYMTLMNWAVFFNNYIFKKKWTSAVPLIGGIAGALGCVILPTEGSWRFFWIPLLIDWGSLPVILVSLVTSKRKN